MCSFNLLIIFCLVIFCAKATLAGFSTNCVNGLYTCTSSDVADTISTAVTLSNCVYVRCPVINVNSGGSITANNLTFLYANDPQGSFYFNAGSMGNFNNVNFYHSYHTSQQSISVDGTNAIVLVANSIFSNTTGVKGAVNVKNRGMFNCTSCIFQYGLAVSAGQGVAVNGANGAISTLNSCIFRNHTRQVLKNSNGGTFMYVNDCIFTDFTSQLDKGLLLWASSNSAVIATNVTALRIWANGNGAAAGCYQGGTVSIDRSYFYNLYSTAQGGGFLIQYQCSITINNSIFDTSYSVSDGGLWFFYSQASLYVYNSVVRNSYAGGFGGVANLQASCFMSLVNVSISYSNSNRDGGIIAPQTGSVAMLTDVTITNVVGTSAVFVADDASITIDGNTVFSNCTGSSSTKAGGIVLSGNSNCILKGNTKIIGNVGDQAGGIYLRDSSVLTWASPNILVSGNIARSAPLASGVRFASGMIPPFYLNISAGVQINMTQDNFYVDSAAVASWLLGSGSGIYNNFVRMTNFRGKPSTLSIIPATYALTDASPLTGSAISSNFTMNLKVNQPLPPVTVVAVEYFGLVSPANPNAPVVATLVPPPNVVLTGEYYKAIVDNNLNSATIKDVSIQNIVPGSYTFNITYIGSTLTPMTVNPLPLSSFTINYADCNPANEYLVPSEAKCYPATYISNGLRVGFGVISIFNVLGGFAAIFYLFHFREYHVVKANSITFLGLTTIGCILMSLSVTTEIASYNASCMISNWLENIGFTLIFGSLWLKTSRILQIFEKKQRNANVMKDEVLLTYLSAVVLVVVAYMIAWQVVQPSNFSLVYVLGYKVYYDPCSQGAFSTVSILIRFFTQLALSYLAYSIRNVPDDFNESKQIGFVCYNWVIFGALMLLVQQYGVSDLEVAYGIGAASTILTTLITMGNLIFYKIYLCINKPTEYKDKKNTSNFIQPFSEPGTNNTSNHAGVTKDDTESRIRSEARFTNRAI